MKYQAIALLAPLTLLTACTTVQPAYKDIGTRTGPCADGGPDYVAQQFYDLRTKQPTQGLPDTQQLAKYRPYLSDSLYQTLLKAGNETKRETTLAQGDLFSSLAAGPTSASVADASTIPDSDARNIPLRVSLSQDDGKWQDEVLMVREGTCWAIDDIRYLSPTPHLDGGSLRQRLLK
ncbi:lipoprotein [Erwinia psidii]|uniref:Lipoprotein n=1 Tax=Erwinia psidii TaxID=69224 RepID=A0A3N6UZI9_9GAMM|nr:lipoprotein [Erwinia psidii]MCX8957358.1 lipoprotein [Erwinia psidii]MCX8959728.1 lipoprotein [Erwinia psidii]MCX8964671.1 lipoprotein [Erwinia psidii]RQM38215.1 lipoprotein [Erwinia psidii]